MHNSVDNFRYNPDQARVPRGVEEGGRWMDTPSALLKLLHLPKPNLKLSAFTRKEYDKKRNAWIGKTDLTADQAYALKIYGREFGKEINKRLRNGESTDRDKELIKQLDSVIEEHGIAADEPMLVYRGTKSDTVYEFHDASFLSTTTDTEVAEEFGRHSIQEIEISEGTKYIYGEDGEYELIFPRGSHLEPIGDGRFTLVTPEAPADEFASKSRSVADSEMSPDPSDEWIRAVTTLSKVDRFEFLSKQYMQTSCKAQKLFVKAFRVEKARPKPNNAKLAKELAEKLGTFLQMNWGNAAKQVKTRSKKEAEKQETRMRVLDEIAEDAKSLFLNDETIAYNWVEEVGGLPRYIRDIADALMRRGTTEGRAIATAVNTVKRWARGGPARQGGEGHVSKKTQLKAAKALIEWEAKKARAKATALEEAITLADSVLENENESENENGKSDAPLELASITDEQSDLIEDDQLPLVAASAPIKPPLAWFTDPQLTAPTPIQITDDGHVFGHLAAWNTCHTANPAGHGVCVSPPASATGYARFHLGTIETAEGQTVSVGKITMNTGHAGTKASPAATLAHYDNTGTAVADVRAGEDGYGIWISGALRPGVSDEKVRVLRASPLSGDWRSVDGNLELHAALAVNVPGFPIPQTAGLVASGELTSLVASGIVVTEETGTHAEEALEAADSQLTGLEGFSAEDIEYLRELAETFKAEKFAKKVARVDALASARANRKKVAAFARRKKVANFAATNQAFIGRYNPDQWRAPAHSPGGIGGQWIETPGGLLNKITGQRIVRSEGGGSTSKKASELQVGDVYRDRFGRLNEVIEVLSPNISGAVPNDGGQGSGKSTSRPAFMVKDLDDPDAKPRKVVMQPSMSLTLPEIIESDGADDEKARPNQWGEGMNEGKELLDAIPPAGTDPNFDPNNDLLWMKNGYRDVVEALKKAGYVDLGGELWGEGNSVNNQRAAAVNQMIQALKKGKPDAAAREAITQLEAAFADGELNERAGRQLEAAHSALSTSNHPAAAAVRDYMGKIVNTESTPGVGKSYFDFLDEPGYDPDWSPNARSEDQFDEEPSQLDYERLLSEKEDLTQRGSLTSAEEERLKKINDELERHEGIRKDASGKDLKALNKARSALDAMLRQNPPPFSRLIQEMAKLRDAGAESAMIQDYINKIKKTYPDFGANSFGWRN